MRRLDLALAAATLLLAGCGGARVPLEPLLQESAGYDRDIEALKPQGQAAAIRDAALRKNADARSLIEKGRGGDALPLLEMAIADQRAALGAALADRARARADECLRLAESARERWEEMLILLEQTERVAGRRMEAIPRTLPPMAANDTIPLPRTAMQGADPPPGPADSLKERWNAWAAAAFSRGIAASDLTARFDRDVSAVPGKEGAGPNPPLPIYRAARTLQELESRVRASIAEQVCPRAAARTALLGDARDEGLRASLELERGLKADLRTELDKVREEARTRQSQLYDAMLQLQGKYAQITQEARGTIVSLSDILFDFDQATLKRDTEFNLVKIATILNQFPEMRIRVEGHTDNVGTPEYNLDLSRRRAQAVRDFLASQQISADRMSVEGFGMTRPVADNDTEEGRRKNRRVDLVIQEKP